MNVIVKKILVIGADRVMPKLFYFADHLRALDTRYVVYTHERTEDAVRYAEKYGAEIVQAPAHRKSAWRMLEDAVTLFRATRDPSLVHAELYSDYHILASLMYFMVLRTRRVPVVLWCRGELYDWKHFSWWQRLYFRIVVPRASLVILKETYMRGTLEAAGIRAASVLELHNTVPLQPITEPDESKEIRLLFLNMFKTWRNVSFLPEVAAALRRRGVPFEMSIVGEKSDSPGLVEEAQKLRAAVTAHGVADCVNVYPFSSNPSDHYRNADIFLLPANLIYCNYALLEAMSYGQVPLVNNADQDYRLIIEDAVSGYGLPLDAELWAARIAELASNRELHRSMSQSARRRIESQFSTSAAFDRYQRATAFA